ncbi:hypothetical protein THAOC_07909, partial [Thalassiosira oceanica]
VAIYEDTIVVGAGRDDDNGESSGSAHVFVRSGEEWTHQVKLLAPDGAVADWFGDSVAIYEDTIVVGAQRDDDMRFDSGSALMSVRWRISVGDDEVQDSGLRPPNEARALCTYRGKAGEGSTQPNATKHGKLGPMTMADNGQYWPEVHRVVERCSPEQNRPLIPILASDKAVNPAIAHNFSLQVECCSTLHNTRREGHLRS